MWGKFTDVSEVTVLRIISTDSYDLVIFLTLVTSNELTNVRTQRSDRTHFVNGTLILLRLFLLPLSSLMHQAILKLCSGIQTNNLLSILT